MSTELLPCPWCGETGVTCAETSTYRWAAASCENCGLVGPEIRKAYNEEQSAWEPRAIEAWNTRAASARIQELEALLTKEFGSGWEDQDAAHLRVANRRIKELTALLAESQAALAKASRDLMEVSLEARGLGNPAVPSLELHAAEAGWVSAGDRLPLHEQEVICTGWKGGEPSDQGRFIACAVFHQDGLFYNNDTGDDYYPPTHWRMLPSWPESGQQGRAPAARGLGNPAVPSLELHAAETGWRSMDDVPKDGTNVLLINRKGNMATGLWQGFGCGEGWWLRGGSEPNAFFNGHHGPTHWMPLPAPPKSGQQGRVPAAGAERPDEQILPRAPGESAYPGHATSGREGATPSDGANPQDLGVGE